MRVVLDTDVVVSGLFFGGVPRAILDLVADGEFELVLSPAILDEYHRTYDRLAVGHPELHTREPLLHLLAYGTLVPNPPTHPPITKDSEDDKVMIALAMPVRSSYPVTDICLRSRDGTESRFSPLAPF